MIFTGLVISGFLRPFTTQNVVPAAMLLKIFCAANHRSTCGLNPTWR
jgi:hypothetical protein